MLFRTSTLAAIAAFGFATLSSGYALAAGIGQTCGGFIGIPCDAGTFCEMAPGTCSVRDGFGTCQARPKAYPMIYLPVCGCDGKTYPSDFARRSAGVSKDHDGKCVKRRR